MLDDKTKTQIGTMLPTYTGNDKLKVISDDVIAAGTFIPN